MQKEGQIRIPSGCAISGIIDLEGKPISGDEIIRSISTMHDRSNGLGGGFAAYGIYPQYKSHYAFHVFYEVQSAKETCEKFLERHFDIANLSKIPTRKHPRITDAPLIWRYFMRPLENKLDHSQLDEKEYVMRCVTQINTTMPGAHVFSSGKNMGVFKAVGYPEDVGEFYCLEDYKGYDLHCRICLKLIKAYHFVKLFTLLISQNIIRHCVPQRYHQTDAACLRYAKQHF